MADGAPANIPTATPKKGLPRPFGRYILEKSLSRGGMGEIFVCVPRGMDARCVIKTIRSDLTGDKEFVGRFADEAKIMTRIAHKNIIRIFDCGKVGHEYYIAMEYLFGRDLGDVLDRAYERGEPMPKELGLYIAEQLLEGLDYIHNLKAKDGRPMRLIHRDISPQNVLMSYESNIKLIDFGLARTELLPGRTQGALAVGKYGYMSPEQARHERIDGRADLYSLGVMLFEIFTGDRLVDEQDQASLWARVLNPKHRNPRSVLPELPKEIDDLVMTAVGPRPEDRFQSAKDMLEFVRGMRTRTATRQELMGYLDYLYPHVEKKAPPLPDFSQVAEGESEYSMIIALSEEGAKSVFGRGELPVQFTTQVNLADLLPELERRRAQRREAEYGNEATLHDSLHTSPSRPMVMEESVPGPIANKALIATKAPAINLEDDDIPTRVQHHDEPRRMGGLPENEATAFARPPPGARPFSDDRTHAAGHMERSADEDKFRDDEATIMMDAPPPVNAVRWHDEESAVPTRIAPGPSDAPRARRGPRKIKERVLNRESQDTRHTEDEVDSNLGPSPQGSLADTTEAEAYVTETPVAPNWLLLSLILVGITGLIFGLVLLLRG